MRQVVKGKSRRYSTHKLYMADTGLLVTHAFGDRKHTDNALYRAHSSLDKFRKKFSRTLGDAIILYTKDVMVKDGVMHLPIYMAMFL